MSPPSKKGPLFTDPKITDTGLVQYRVADSGQFSTDKLREFQKLLKEIFKISEMTFWSLAQVIGRIDDEIQRRTS